jgi:hypothetical protein
MGCGATLSLLMGELNFQTFTDIDTNLLWEQNMIRFGAGYVEWLLCTLAAVAVPHAIAFSLDQLEALSLCGDFFWSIDPSLLLCVIFLVFGWGCPSVASAILLL